MNWIEEFLKTRYPFTYECIVPSLAIACTCICLVVLEKKFFYFMAMYFSYFVNIFPWKRAWTALCQVWLKLVQWFCKGRFSNFIKLFFLFHYHLPLEKGETIHLMKLESSLPKNALCSIWLKLAQWFLKRKVKMRKVYRQTDGRWTTGEKKSSLELRCAKKAF